MLSRRLLVSVLLFGIGVVSGVLLTLATPSVIAQGTAGGLSPDRGRSPAAQSIYYENNVLMLRSRNGLSFPPTVFGMLLEGDQEPIGEQYHRATWTFCKVDSNILICEDRMNYNGSVLRRTSSKWTLTTPTQ